MFYINSKKYSSTGDLLYGVVDTSDNVEEFYSRDSLKEFTNNGVSIKGMTYTGSDYKFEVLSLSVIFLDTLDSGDVFTLYKNGVKTNYLYVGKDSVNNYVVYDGDDKSTLIRDILVTMKDSVAYVDVSSYGKKVSDALRESYIRKFPNDNLSSYLFNVDNDFAGQGTSSVAKRLYKYVLNNDSDVFALRKAIIPELRNAIEDIGEIGNIKKVYNYSENKGIIILLFDILHDSGGTSLGVFRCDEDGYFYFFDTKKTPYGVYGYTTGEYPIGSGRLYTNICKKDGLLQGELNESALYLRLFFKGGYTIFNVGDYRFKRTCFVR